MTSSIARYQQSMQLMIGTGAQHGKINMSLYIFFVQIRGENLSKNQFRAYFRSTDVDRKRVKRLIWCKALE
jgi:hypothetical protein